MPMHLDAMPMHPDAILMHLDAILMHPDAILMHPDAILMHPDAIKNAALLRKTLLSYGGCKLTNLAIWAHFLVK
ncbi:hypothetical protein NIES4075_55680 [Tolypothrix sp. NIES-4075]|uniref:hypothetical protein n=1 Tax=Tolypothrix sp. NIES-4075 TaxID=2005459 RepID=UPI000B5C896B|nr:hypothetical protein [Tolypothrix sp. NIES-4075]GAX44549.1 hypothetical protein NIES4075_55680 [Tolypothrix sp. NIES-4075]